MSYITDHSVVRCVVAEFVCIFCKGEIKDVSHILLFFYLHCQHRFLINHILLKKNTDLIPKNKKSFTKHAPLFILIKEIRINAVVIKYQYRGRTFSCVQASALASIYFSCHHFPQLCLFFIPAQTIKQMHACTQARTSLSGIKLYNCPAFVVLFSSCLAIK